MAREQGKQRPILVPVDFSSHSAAALVWAADLARTLDAPVLVLHVVHDPASEPGYYATSNRSGQLRGIEESAELLMQSFLEDVLAEHPEIGRLELDTSLVVGLPASRILEVAAKVDARLIVMGSRGLTGIAHLLLGSKAERVVQLAPIPVTIVKAPEADVGQLATAK
jgi:nucleotide-binding universal stress UspA family protein